MAERQGDGAEGGLGDLGRGEDGGWGFEQADEADLANRRPAARSAPATRRSKATTSAALLSMGSTRPSRPSPITACRSASRSAAASKALTRTKTRCPVPSPFRSRPLIQRRAAGRLAGLTLSSRSRTTASARVPAIRLATALCLAKKRLRMGAAGAEPGAETGSVDGCRRERTRLRAFAVILWAKVVFLEQGHGGVSPIAKCLLTTAIYKTRRYGQKRPVSVCNGGAVKYGMPPSSPVAIAQSRGRRKSAISVSDRSASGMSG